MSIINKLSLRRQIWIGFNSVLLLVIIVSAISFFRLLQVQDQATDIAEYSQPAMLSALTLKENIQSATSLMSLYIINKTPEYEKLFKQEVSKLQQVLTEYKDLPAVQNDNRMQQASDELDSQIQQFVEYQERIDFLNKNFIENYPALKIANREINTRHQQSLQIFSDMVNSEFDETPSEQRRDLLQLINDVRQNWMITVTLFRTFLANPSIDRINQITIYIKQNRNLMKKLSANEEIFTFEQSEGLASLNSISVDYFKYLDEIFAIHKQGLWREDVSLIKNNITPLINKISTQIDSIIDYQKSQVKTGNNELITKTKSTISYIVIVLIISLIVGIAAARFTCKQINCIVNEINRILNNILSGDFSSKMDDQRAGDIGLLGGNF